MAESEASRQNLHSIIEILNSSPETNLKALKLVDDLSREQLLVLVRELLLKNGALQAENSGLRMEILKRDQSPNEGFPDIDLTRNFQTFKAIVGASPTAIVITDTDGKVTDWNIAATRIFGWSASEAVGSRIPLKIKHDSQDPNSENMDAIGQFSLFEGRCLKKDKTRVDVSVSTGPLIDGKGNLVGTVYVAIDITERKNAGAHAQKWMKICQHADWGIVVSSPDGLTLEMMNPAFARMHGYSEQDIDGCPWEHVVAEQSRSEITKHLQATLSKGRHSFESMHVRSDGTVFPALVNSSLVMDAQGHIAFRVFTVQDISELRRIEDLLRKSRETFTALLDAISESAFLLSPDGVVLAVNQTTVKRLGKTFQGVIGRSIFELFEYKLAKARKALIDKVVTTGNPEEFEDECKGRYLHNNLYPSFDSNGNVMGVAGYSIDITERKQTQEELKKYQTHLEDLVRERTGELHRINQLLTQEVEERRQAELTVQMSASLLRAVFDAISDGLLVGNLFHGVESLNSKFKEMWNLNDEHTQKADSAELLDYCAQQTKDPEKFVKRIFELYSPNIAESFDEIEMKDGRVFERRSKLYQLGEKTYGRVWSYKDITDRIRTHRELLAARDQAQSADHAKSAFLAMMSHEIRTPINAIMGLSYICLQTQLTPKQIDYLEKIHASSEALLRIVNDVLDFSKIEAGRLELEIVSFNLESTIRNVFEMISLKAEQKGLELIALLDEHIPDQLLGDPLRLEQIIKNLADNAVKFTEKGEVTISAQITSRYEDRVDLRIDVSDTGIGLTDDQISNLFKPFVQADSSTTRKYGGSGLGLSICRRLAEIMGGRISVSSLPGEGTTFSLDLTLSKSKGSIPREYNLPDILKGSKALVLEDNERVRCALADLLQSLGMKAATAGNIADAMRLFGDSADEEPFSLVLLDVGIPYLGVPQVCNHIKNHPNLKLVPDIILMAGYATSNVMSLVSQSSADGFLTKPLTLSSVFNGIVCIHNQERTCSERPSRLKARQKEREVSARLGGAKVLLIEDNEINRQVALELLTTHGLIVTIATNGQEGVEAVNTSEFDAVLTDIQMPVMDGYETAAKIRKDPRFAKLPIIAMTAHVMADELEKCISAGMNDHISKPIDPVALYSVLLKWIDPKLTIVDENKAIRQTHVHSKGAGLPELRGVDVNSGLARVGGDQEFFRRMLQKFRQNHANDAYGIAVAISSGDFETAARMAHTLKGVAGGLGADCLQLACQDLEFMIKNADRSMSANYINPLRHELTKVLDSVSEMDEAYTDPGPESIENNSSPSNFDPQAVRNLCEKFKLLVEDNDTASYDALTNLENCLSGKILACELKKLRDSLERYDFDSASDSINEIIARLNESGGSD